MKSRVHPTYKTKCHVQNWAAYDRALVCRGDITSWLSPAAIAAWDPDGAGPRGAPRKYSDLAIESALTLRLLFHLPRRQTAGCLTALFVLRGLDLRSPDHTTLSRRGQHLDLRLRSGPRRAGLHLLIDSTGLSIAGAGEWATAKHGGRGTRGWKKLHVGVDHTGVIVAHALTDATRPDSAYAPFDTPGLMRIPWPTDGGPILFQHGFEYLQARRDDQLLELGLCINEDIDQRQVPWRRGYRLATARDCARLLLHGGSFLGGLHLGFVTGRIARPVKSRRFKFQQLLGHPLAPRDALLPKLISVELRIDVGDTMNMPHDARVG